VQAHERLAGHSRAPRAQDAAAALTPAARLNNLLGNNS